MTLGKKLKALRAEHELSQPELAEKIGIEQSYLSKLENDKSVPSNDIFRHILRVFSLDITTFLADFEQGANLDNLRKIPDVEHYFAKQKMLKQSSQRRLLYIASLLIVLATTIFFIGYSKQVFTETHYEYSSRGVILQGESEDIFYNWHSLMAPEDTANGNTVRRRRVEMNKREQPTILLSPINQGSYFVIPVEGGKRKYLFEKTVTIDRSINAWLQVLGVLLLSAGVMGFVLERRLFKAVL